jgi:cytoskeletal protein RodZ
VKSTSTIAPKAAGAVIISSVFLISVYFLFLDAADYTQSTSSKSASASTSQAAPQNTNTNLSSVEQAATISVETSQEATAQTSPTPKVDAKYTDGTYAVSETYVVPKGHTNTISLSITIQNDAISSVETDHQSVDQESTKYISRFDSAVSGIVNGAKLDDAIQSRIGGASLTTSAFKDALELVRSQAIN